MNIKKQQMQKDLKLHRQRKHIFMLILPRVSVTLREFSVLNCTYPMKAMKIGSIRMFLKRLYFLKREILSRSEEHTSELQSRFDLVCRLLLEKKTRNIHRDGRAAPGPPGPVGERRRPGLRRLHLLQARRRQLPRRLARREGPGRAGRQRGAGG